MRPNGLAGPRDRVHQKAYFAGNASKLCKSPSDARHFFRAGCSVYDGFAKLSVEMHEFIPKAGYSKPGEGGMGRMNQYLRDMVRERRK